MDWIEKNMGKMMCIFAVIFLIEAGIGVWRQPKEFRSSIIPKLNRQIYQYQSMIDRLEELYILKDTTHWNERRIDMLSESQESKIRILFHQKGNIL